MITPTVTELPRHLEAVTSDPFIEELAQPRRVTDAAEQRTLDDRMAECQATRRLRRAGQ